MTVNLQVLLKINVLHNVQKIPWGVDHTQEILGQYLVNTIYTRSLLLNSSTNQSEEKPQLMGQASP